MNMTAVSRPLAALALLASATAAHAGCWQDGVGTQRVTLMSEGKRLDSWEPKGDEIRTVRLPAGFQLGIQTPPATPEKYRELFDRHASIKGMDELVKIDLYDMSVVPPVLLSTTWGGANSIQGFGPRGGANGVPAMVDQVELHFHKPVCITPEKLKSADAAKK